MHPTAHVTGPYLERLPSGRASWRAVAVFPGGERVTLRGGTKKQALQRAKARLADPPPTEGCKLTLAEALAKYVTAGNAHGWDRKTAWMYEHELRTKLLGERPDAPLLDLDAAWLKRYLARTAHLALGTQKTRWGIVHGFCAWCAAQPWGFCDPTPSVHKFDRPWLRDRGRHVHRGKPQLPNVPAARAYLAAALTLPTAKDRAPPRCCRS